MAQGAKYAEIAPPFCYDPPQARVLAYYPNWCYNLVRCDYSFGKDEEEKSVSAV
jgi:hypothetical protein